MAEARAPFLIGKFLEGYMGGMRQANQDRQEKAMNLMQLAMANAGAINESVDVGARTLAMEQFKKSMNEAHKMMTEEVGVWPTISKLFMGKGAPQDPIEMLKQFNMAPGQMGTQEVPVGGVMPGVATAIGPPKKEAKEVPGVASTITGVPSESLPGPIGPLGASTPMAPPISAAPSISTPAPVAPLPQPIGARVSISVRKPPRGVKSPEEATAEGPEQVEISPGQVELRLDGVQVSPKMYNTVVQSMAMRNIERRFGREERSEIFQEDLAKIEATQRIKMQGNENMAEQYKKIVDASGEPWTQKNWDIYNNIVTGATIPDRKVGIDTSHIFDDNTGKEFIVRKYMTPEGRLTGEPVVPPQEVPPNEMGVRIRGMMAQAGISRTQAIVNLGKWFEQDANLQQRINQLRVTDAILSNQIKQREADHKARLAAGTLTRIEYIQRAHEDSVKWVLAANPYGVEDAMGALKEYMRTNYNISWDEYIKTIGGPENILRDIAAADKARLQQGAGGGSLRRVPTY